MPKQSVTEQLETLAQADAAFPYDGRITQIFTNTVNIMRVGSRTVTRDVALPAHIKAEDIGIGWAVRLAQVTGKPTVVTVYEQFADDEMFNYAGRGVSVPATPRMISVKATSGGWVITWATVPGASRLVLYKNDDPDVGSPEEVITLPGNATTFTAGYDPPFCWFAVKAFDAYLEGDISNWLTDQTPPPAPVWVSDSFQSDGHHLVWKAGPNAVAAETKEYILYRNTSAAEGGATLIVQTNKLNYVADYNDTLGNYFGVRSVDWAGNQSTIIWVLYDPTPTATPDHYPNMVQIGGYVVTWDAVAKAESYEIYYSPTANDADENAQQIWFGKALYTPIIAKTGYNFFKARAIGFDDTAGPWSVWRTDSRPPTKPILATTGGVKTVSVGLAVSDTSHNSIGLHHYKLEIANSSGGAGAATLDTTALYSSFPRTLTQVTGVTKYFRLTAYDWADNASTPSDWTPATPSSEGAAVQDKFDGYGGSIITTSLDSLYWLGITNGEETIIANTNPSAHATPWNRWFGMYGGLGYLANLSRIAMTHGDGVGGIRMELGSAGGTQYGRAERYFSYPGKAGTLVSLNLSAENRFTDDDYITITIDVPTAVYNLSSTTGPGGIYLRDENDLVAWAYFALASYAGSDPYWLSLPKISPGVNHLKYKRSLLQEDVGFDWSAIYHIDIDYTVNTGTPSSSYAVNFDDIRIVKADPDNAAIHNDTGRAWDYSASTGTDFGEWHIYTGNRTSEPGKPFSLGQINHQTSPSKWYLAHKPVGLDILSGTIQSGIFHKENGKNGLAFFVHDVTPGSWDMYAVEVDNVGDTVKLVKYVAGTRTELASATFATISGGSGTAGQTYWLGVNFSEFDADAGRIKVYAALSEGNLIQAGNLKISIQDTSVGSGGTVGLLSNQANVRFVNFTAGSPAHAETADVAKALDGPIIAGDVRRVHYNTTLNRWEYADDGLTFLPVAPLTSAARPGVTRLYRRDNDSDFSVQAHWDTARWWLRGYSAGDIFHAEVRVGLADAATLAANSSLLGGYSLAQTKANGAVVKRTSDQTGIVASTWTPVTWQAVVDNTAGAMWAAGTPTRLTCQRAGWHALWAQVNIDQTVASANVALRLLHQGATVLAQQSNRKPSDTNNVALTVSIVYYLAAGEYLEAWVLSSGAAFLDADTAGSPGCSFGMVSLEQA